MIYIVYGIIYIVEDISVFIVVDVRVKVVDMDGVDIENLYESGIMFVFFGVVEGIDVGFGVVVSIVFRLVGYINDLEFVVGVGIDELLVFDF